MASFVYEPMNSLANWDLTETEGPVTIVDSGAGYFFARAQKDPLTTTAQATCGAMLSTTVNLSVGNVAYWQGRHDIGPPGGMNYRFFVANPVLATPSGTDSTQVFSSSSGGVIRFKAGPSQGTYQNSGTGLGSLWVDFRLEIVASGQVMTAWRASTNLAGDFDPDSHAWLNENTSTTITESMTANPRYLGWSTFQPERTSDIMEVHVTDDGTITRPVPSEDSAASMPTGNKYVLVKGNKSNLRIAGGVVQSRITKPRGGV